MSPDDYPYIRILFVEVLGTREDAHSERSCAELMYATEHMCVPPAEKVSGSLETTVEVLIKDF